MRATERPSYLEWLCLNAGLRRNSRVGRMLHEIPFRYFVENDVNRAVEGKELRDYYIDHISGRSYTMSNTPCSMLEMLVALGRRANDIACGLGIAEDATEWTLLFLYNMGLTKKEHYTFNEVKRITDRVVDRTYDSDGNGGIFPLRRPLRDQRRRELWYQLNDYIDENEVVGEEDYQYI